MVLEGLPLEQADLEEEGVKVDCCCIIPPLPPPLVPVGKSITEGVGGKVIRGIRVGHGETQPEEEEV